MNGFQELRNNGILHRDFKLANVLMNDGIAIIGDFGLASKNEFCVTNVGTPISTAPELLIKDFVDDGKKYDSKIDIWSIGVSFYQLLFGVYPFNGLNKKQLLNSIRDNAGKNLSFPRLINEQIVDILQKMLTINP